MRIMKNLNDHTFNTENKNATNERSESYTDRNFLNQYLWHQFHSKFYTET